MNKGIKDLLGLVVIAVLGIFAYATVQYVGSYAKSIQPSSFRSFSVSAEGKAVTVPDIAQFNCSIITEGGKNIGALQKENAEKANKVTAFIKSSGIAAKDIKTEDYSLIPRYQNYFPNPVISPERPVAPPEIVGYTVSQTVSVKIRDFAKIGDILAGVIQNGANKVSELSFTIDDPTKIQDQARNEAIAKAQEKAVSIAKAANFRLGRLLSLEEGSTPQPFFMQRAMMKGAGADFAAAAPPAIEAGSQEVIVTVTLKYEIE